jgi:hypothetical protein
MLLRADASAASSADTSALAASKLDVASCARSAFSERAASAARDIASASLSNRRRAAASIGCTGSGVSRAWLNSSATPAPMAASSRRAVPATAGPMAITRTADTPDWMASTGVRPKASATIMAGKATMTMSSSGLATGMSRRGSATRMPVTSPIIM